MFAPFSRSSNSVIGVLSLVLLTVPTPESGHVTLPVATWAAMQREIADAAKTAKPDVPVAALGRSLDGRFDKGLLRATLTSRFDVLGEGHVRVPIVDGRASLGNVELDGKRTSLLLEGGMYTVGIDTPGPHTLVAEIFYGKEQDRFARRLAFRIPTDGATAVDILLPERDVDVSLSGGSVTAKNEGDGTRVTGAAGAKGKLDLAWRRRLTHDSPVAMRSEAEMLAVVALRESVLDGVATIAVRVLEGETDRIDLAIPPALEIIAVEGDAVLQWKSEGEGKLAVLLRYLVEDEVRITVKFQAPVDPGAPIEVRLPTPREGTAFSGALGVEAAPGLEVKVIDVKDAETLGSRDVPSELADLSPTPLAHAFRFTQGPTLHLSAARQAEIEMTSTIVDELQASTVILESGLEITKIKLRARNNTRQYLSVALPPGALLTHSLVDGEPIRPARADVKPGDEGGDELLVPLRQSERISGGGRTHVVRPGETLSDVANFYFSDPSAYQTILDGNADVLGGGVEIQEGQTLRIPTRAGATVEESSFVIELAYKREGRQLGLMGVRKAELPRIDVDVVGATWHVYLPAAIEPLGFGANLTQVSALRYDPFRRARDFFDLAFGVRNAWAGSGGSEYQNILSQRKAIWKSEAEAADDGDAVLATFPLVGERYRFKRLLMGRDRPELSVVYAARTVETAARHGTLIAAFALGLYLFSRRRTRGQLASTAIALLALILLAHFFLGLHRRLVWGLDLALLALVLLPLARRAGAWLMALFREPWRLLELIRWRTLLVLLVLSAVLGTVLIFPLFLSSIALVILVGLRLAQAEVRHV